MWAIALGIIIMIIALATGNGLRNEIRSKITGFGGHIQILNYQPNPTYEQDPITIGDSLLLTIQNLEGVTHIQKIARKAGIIKQQELFEGAILKGVDSTFNWQFFESYLQEGNSLNLSGKTYNDSVIISQNLANKLSLQLHDKFSMYFVRELPKPPLLRYFHVAGIYKTDFEEIDNNYLLGDLKHVLRLNRWEKDQAGNLEIYLSDEDLMLEKTLAIRAILPFEYDALTARQLNEQLFQWLDLFDLNILIVLIIMIVVATINMSIALLILILERTQMIGILKALGSYDLSIRKIFLLSAANLIAKGLLWGNIIGIGLCLLQQYFGLIKLDPSTYYVSEVSIDLNLFHLILLNAGTVLICLASLVLPSFVITRISPVKAIRFD